MCLLALESGPGLAGYCITSDLVEHLFRRVARQNRPIIGSATNRNTPREVFAVPSLMAQKQVFSGVLGGPRLVLREQPRP